MKENIERALLTLLRKQQDADTVNAVVGDALHGHHVTYRDGVLTILDQDGQRVAKYSIASVSVTPSNLDDHEAHMTECSVADEEDKDEEDGDWTLTLYYNGVPRSDVEHTAEDCTRNGDNPAESFDIIAG